MASTGAPVSWVSWVGTVPWANASPLKTSTARRGNHCVPTTVAGRAASTILAAPVPVPHLLPPSPLRLWSTPLPSTFRTPGGPGCALHPPKGCRPAVTPPPLPYCICTPDTTPFQGEWSGGKDCTRCSPRRLVHAAPQRPLCSWFLRPLPQQWALPAVGKDPS